jgi:hypothetical protein
MAWAMVVPGLAATYSDLTGQWAWAEPYMKDLADKGYLTGYSDGTMRPGTNMTAAETLVMLSRFYSPGDTETAMMRADYFDYVLSSVPTSLVWAYNNLIVCLGAGIVTKDEIKTINLNAEIKKEQLAVFLVRAMQLTKEADALSGTSLNFADAGKITSSCYTSVAKLYALKIITGDLSNNFAPQSSVTRAVVATMVSRALDYLEDNKKTLVLEDYTGVTHSEGIIKSVGAGTVNICGFDGLTREYPVPATASVTVNGTAKTLSTVYIDCYTGISFKNGAISKLEIDNTAGVKWVQGAVNSIIRSGNEVYVYVRDLETAVVTPHYMTSSVAIFKDGVSVGSSVINYDDFISLKIENTKYVKGVISSGKFEMTGTITEINYGSTITMKVTDSSGIVYRFSMYFNDLPVITRGSTTISVDRLKAGNAVTIKMDDCKIVQIISTGTEDTVSGELTSITATKTGTLWVLTKADGTTVSLKLDENAGAYSGTKAILLSDIKVGDEVTVVVYGDTITEIHVKSAVASSDKVIGSVLSVDLNQKVITLLTAENKLIYVNTSGVLSVINSSTGINVRIMDIEPNQQIVAYGAYKDATHFNATSIIIE